MTISEQLLPEFDQEMVNTRKVLALVPQDRFDYRPHVKSMTLGQLAGHVAEMASWTVTTIDEESLDLAPASGEKFVPFMAQSPEEVLAAFDRNIAAARAAIARASDEELGKTWTLLVTGQEIFSMPRAAVLRTMVMNHIIHHRAQLGVYLRMLDIAIPGMYGPSADEMQGFAAQSA